MSELVACREAASRYVAVLFGSVAGGLLIEVRFRAASGMRQRFFSTGTLGPVVDTVLALATRTGCAPAEIRMNTGFLAAARTTSVQCRFVSIGPDRAVNDEVHAHRRGSVINDVGFIHQLRDHAQR